jgi:hypothetical protein
MLIIPTEDQLAERWDLLSDGLKDALTSEATSALVWKTAEAEHIPDAKIYEIGRAVSHVLYGFIHPEDLPIQLREDPQLNPQTVAALSNAFNQKIFAALQQDLSHAYAPLIRGAAVAGPKMIQSDKPMPAQAMPTASIAPKAPVAAPQIISQSFTATPKFSAMPLTPAKPVAPAPAAIPAQPPSTPSAGWSTRAPQGPVIKFGAVTPSVPTTTPAAKSPQQMPPLQRPQQQPVKGMSEFERLDAMKKGGVVPSAPTIPASPTMPASPATPAAVMPQGPVMLHEVSNTAAQTPDFRFKMGMQNQMPSKPPQVPLPSKPAVLEFGRSATPGGAGQTPAAQPIPVPSAPKTVHYTEYKPSPAEPHQISEITTPAPKPQQGKVIVKDFLEPQK